MFRAKSPQSDKSLPMTGALLLGLVAAVGYWIAFATECGAAAILVAIPCLCALGRSRTDRQAFYGGVAVGVLAYGPLLAFFWSVFGPVAIALWLVAGFPVGAFLLLLRKALLRLGDNAAMWLTPMLWTGVEYFRSEVWQLKFAWLLPGQAMAFVPGVRMAAVGVYGLSFIIAIIAAMIVSRRVALRAIGVVAALVLAELMYVPALPPSPVDGTLHVAGVQIESAGVEAVAGALDRLAEAHPEAQILVLSEYTFVDVVPQSVRDVATKYHRYLVAGGIQWLDAKRFYDTAFVIGPDGRDVASQGKSVPVQFMDDGLPAARRQVWESPWGKIGIGVCYDVGYARVMDDFVRQGAAGLIVPTNDPMHWGEFERRMLHGRLAPIRAAEYGIPVFGVWSSGVSHLTDRYGRVIATAGFPGQGAFISGPFDLGAPGRVPPDRMLAVAMMFGTGLFAAYLAGCWISQRVRKSSPPGRRCA
jgi:apolipoprotein N-acyltransferase